MAYITVEILTDFANKFATKITSIFAKKTDIPSTLPANGGNADTVNGHTVNTNVPSGAKFTDTTYSNFVKSGTGAKAGLVPAPSTTAGTNKYLREDGTWQTPPDTNTTYNVMTGATTSAAGKSGLVPAPSKGSANRYLCSDGTFKEIAEATTSDIDGIIAGTFN